MRIESNVPLKERTSLKLGGPARFFAEVQSEADLAEALAWSEAEAQPVRILGGGSNVVIPDAGIPGMVVALALRGIEQESAGETTLLHVGAGEPWDELVAFSVQEQLAGLECLSGIPGRVGATPIQNVGAYGQEVSDTIQQVRAFDRQQREFVTLHSADCEFGYRESRFKSREPGRFVVTRVTFALRRGGAACLRYPEVARAVSSPELAATREAVLTLRRSKSMVIDPTDPNSRSCGSFFLNPIVDAATADAVEQRFAPLSMPRYPQTDGRVKLSAAWLIERAGWQKGTRRGNVGISSRHALALVCAEGATSSALAEFAAEVQQVVLHRTGVGLVPEPEFW